MVEDLDKSDPPTKLLRYGRVMRRKVAMSERRQVST